MLEYLIRSKKLLRVKVDVKMKEIYGKYSNISLTTKVKKWGNGNGILLPKALLGLLSLSENDDLSIEVENGSIILKPMKPKRLTLAERFKNYEGETKQSEYWTDNPVGKEII
ncbi:AbrB/MazE/SpoVT family DNA-binding domain-containing protein [Absiella sp. AM29-15]|nr:AbrB/MazE/SpoVT family DNA-binding domain-containing protein [Absiella sp. AM29-15]